MGVRLDSFKCQVKANEKESISIYLLHVCILGGNKVKGQEPRGKSLNLPLDHSRVSISLSLLYFLCLSHTHAYRHTHTHTHTHTHLHIQLLTERATKKLLKSQKPAQQPENRFVFSCHELSK